MDDCLHVVTYRKDKNFFVNTDTVGCTIVCTDVQYHTHQYIPQEKNSVPSGGVWGIHATSKRVLCRMDREIEMRRQRVFLA